MRFKKWPQLPRAGRARAGHHHGSHMPTSPEAVLLGKMAYHTKQIRRQCIIQNLQTSPITQTSFLVGTYFAISHSKTALDYYARGTRGSKFEKQTRASACFNLKLILDLSHIYNIKFRELASTF